MIDPYDVVPKYYQLVNILRQKIEAGELSENQVIPSERELESLYNISRTTIRQAIDVLIRQGFLYREHGRGTFVSPLKLQKGIQELTSFSEDMRNRGLEPGQTILDIRHIPLPEFVGRKLELPKDTKTVLRIERIRLGNNSPMGIQDSYLALPEGKTITLEELSEKGSIYAILREKFNIIPTEAEETLEVTVATKREADLLQIKEGAPLLLSERILWSQYRQAVEYVKILYRGDRYKYTIRLTR